MSCAMGKSASCATTRVTEYKLRTLRKGETFGEKACLMRQDQPASVIAGADTTVLVIPEKVVQLILERNPKVREVLEERIRIVDNRELQRQKKVAERRKPADGARSEIQAGARTRTSSGASPGFSRRRRWTAALPAWR